MTSLREEIHCFINKTDARELADKLSDEIISIFKKRIDEKIIEQDIWSWSHNEPMFRDGYIDAIKDVKEMLK